MSAYMGPWKAGMLVTTGLGGAPADFRLTQAHVDAWTNRDPGGWRPVRPADDDVEAWKLFIPDAPLPDTGPKEFKPGQVWACHAAYPGKADQAIVFKVVKVTNQSRQWLDVVTLAGVDTDGMSNQEWTNRSVLLFGAPEPTAKPAERPLALGWTRKDAFAFVCTYHTGAGMCCRKECVLRGPRGKGGCSDEHAAAQGAFADSPTSEPRQSAATVSRAVDALAALVPKAIPRCGKCSHAGHSGPCGGSSPNGEWGCPCKDLTDKDAKLAARGAYAVGTYTGRAGTHEHSQMSSLRSSDRETGATSVLLANLAREKPPARELPRVRDIYRAGASDE